MKGHCGDRFLPGMEALVNSLCRGWVVGLSLLPGVTSHMVCSHRSLNAHVAELVDAHG